MESEGSDIDDLADLDLATFAQPDRDLSPLGDGQGETDPSQQTGGSSGDREDNNNDLICSRDIPRDEDACLTLDSDFRYDSYIQENTSQHSNPFHDEASPSTNPFYSDSVVPDPFASSVNPFASDPFSTNDMDNLLLSEDLLEMEHQAAQIQSVDMTAGTDTEYVYLNRLPGENLGMVLGIEGDQDNRQPIDAVLVRSVTPGGAAARACEGSNKILVGDEIREIDGRPLTELTHDECIALFQEMPDNVVLTIYRKEKSAGSKGSSPLSSGKSTPKTPAKRKGPPVPSPRKHFTPSGSDTTSLQGDFTDELEQASDTLLAQDVQPTEAVSRLDGHDDTKVPKGFLKLDLTIFREEESSLGLSIVPSYGATCDLYQIKRLLPSGACAQSGLLEIGDRLLSCNGLSLRGLTQAQCLNVLKSSGNLVELVVLRHTDEQAAFTEEAAAEETVFYPQLVPDVSQSPLVDQEKETKSEQEPVVDAEELDGVHAHTQEDLVFNLHSVNVDDKLLINEEAGQLIDLAGNEELTLADNAELTLACGISTEESSSIPPPHIPPPAAFSDADEISEAEYQVNPTQVPEHVTNIDDLLFGESNDKGPGSPILDAETFVLGEPDLRQDQQQSLLVSLDEPLTQDNIELILNEPPTDFLDSAFSPRSLEEFAEECFNNIGKEDSVSQKQEGSEHPEEPLSEVVNVESNSVSYSEEVIDVSNTSERHVTVVSVSSTEVSPEYVTRIPVSAESSDHTETESTSLKLDTHHTHTTSISVNSPPPSNVTHIDIIPNKKISGTQSPPVEESRKDAPSKLVFYTNGGSSLSTSTSATIKIDGLLQNTRSMSEQTSNAVVHTTIGVTTNGQSGEEEDVILPMVVAKDSQGKPLCFPSEQPASEKPEEPRKIDDEAKQEIVNMLAAISTEPQRASQSGPVENGLDDEVSEQEIVPTLLSRNQKEVVLGVISKWVDEESPKKESVLQKAVSGLIASQRDANAVVLTTVGVTNAGQDEEPIQPMAVAKDHQGKPLCVPSPQPERKLPEEVKKIDDGAKKEIVDVLASLSASPPSQLRPSENQPEDTVSENEIVPTVLSNDQKEIVMNTLNQWVNTDSSNEPSAFQRAVTGFMKKDDVASDGEPDKEDGEKNSSSTEEESRIVEEEVVQASTEITIESKPKKVLDTVNVFETGGPESTHDQDADHVVLRSKPQPTADVRGAVNIFEKAAIESAQTHTSDQVVLRPKAKQSTDFRAKIDSFQQPQNSGSSLPQSSVTVSPRRPVSMIEVSSSHSTGPTKFDDIRKSFTTESKAPPSLRPLSAALRPLSASTSNTHRLSGGLLGRPASGSFTSSTFSSRSSKVDYPKSRQEDGNPFQVDVLKGIVGLGLKVKVTPEGHTQVTEIQRGGPIDKNGNVRVGDYLLSINSSELTGQTDARVQQVLRLLPRGLAKLVVTSVAPASQPGTEPQHQSSSQLGVRLSPKPFPSENRSTSPTTTTQTFLASENGIEPYNPPNKDSAPSDDLTLPIFTTAESSVSTSQAPLTARIEITSSSQPGSGPVKIAIKPTPTPRPGQEVLRPKALPRHGYSSSANESWETSSEDSTPRELRGLKGTKAMDAELVAAQRKPAGGEVIMSPGHHSAFENSKAMFEQKSVSKPPPVVPPKPKTRPVPSAYSSHESSQVSSPVSVQHLEHDDEKETKVQSPETPEAPSEKSTIQDAKAESLPCSDTVESPVDEAKVGALQSPVVQSPVHGDKVEVVQSPTVESHEAKVEEVLSPSAESPVHGAKEEGVQSPQQKVPPPVAPKPRLSSSSSTKSEDSVDGEEKPQVKTTPKISAGYERLQAITKASKPSKIIEQSRTFVSSTAKLFDNKSADGETTSDKQTSYRRISMGVVAQSDGSNKAINTSLMPLKERRKSTGTSLSSKPVSLSQPAPLISSSLSKPRSLSSTAKRPSEITIPETSPRDGENSDGKTKTILSPTRLNAALSPRRRSSSSESPTSPPVTFSPKNAPRVKEATASFEGKTHNVQASVEHSGIFKTTPVTVHERKSPSQMSPSHDSITSLHKDVDSRILTREHRSKSFPAPSSSPSPSVSSQIHEDALEDTMKKFDDLLMDAPYTRTETDPNDLLLWAPIRKDSPLGTRPLPAKRTDNQANVQSKTEEVKKPVAPPRTKPTVKEVEKENELKVTQEVKCDSNEKEVQGDSDKISVNKQEEVKEGTTEMPAQTESVKAQSVENLLSGQNDHENVSENIVAANMSEQLMEPKKDEPVKVETVSSSQKDSEEVENVMAANMSEQLTGHDKAEVKPQTVEAILINQEQNEEKENTVAADIAEQIIGSQRNGHHEPEPTSQGQDEVEATGKQITDVPDEHHELSVEKEQDVAHEQMPESSKEENDQGEKTEKEEEKDEIIKTQAVQIVDDVMAKIAIDPTILSQVEEKEIVNQPPSPESSDDEPPPLPGAPPPPPILRDNKLLVSADDLVDPVGSPVVPESSTEAAVEEQISSTASEAVESSVTPSAINLQVNVDDGELIVLEKPDAAEEDHASRADSAEPLNSTGDSYQDGDGLRGKSPSPVDMLSEDSGMPADEDQEGATDDAISPPGEFAETMSGSDPAKHVPFSSQIEMQLSSSIAEPQESISLVISTEKDSKTVTEEAPQADGGKPDDYNDETESVDKDLPPPMLPTSSPPCVTAQHVSTDHNEDTSLSQTSVFPAQDSDSQPLSSETPSHGEGISANEENIETAETNIPDQESESKAEAICEPEEHDDADVVSDITLASSDAQEKDAVETQDASQLSISSKRRWCLRSNKSTSPVLQGDPNISVPIHYAEASLINTLPLNDLESVLGKANAVLDAASASHDMDLTIVHLHREGDSVSLGVDLKHVGGTWFQVSNIQAGSLAQKEGGVKVGDYLVAVDNLWGDQVTVMRFLARLTKPKHDSLLVIARGERPQDVTAPQSARPVPSPRPRSSQKPEKEKPTSPVTVTSMDTPAVNGEPEQAAEPLPAVSSSSKAAVPTDDSPPLPDNPPPLPAEAPPQPDTLPSAPEKVPPPVQKKPAKISKELSESSSEVVVKAVPAVIAPTPNNDAPVKAVPVEVAPKATSEPVVKAVLREVAPVSEAAAAEKSTPSPVGSDDALGPGVHKVIMMKGATGVGFCLEGGVGSPKGNVPITIKRIFKGGPAEKCGQLKVKDEILKVNGLDFTTMRHYEAWNHLKFLDDGEVHITIRRTS